MGPPSRWPIAVDDEGRVHRLVAPNPGPLTLGGTNTYLVGRRQVYIIDPGPDDPRHLSTISAWLQQSGRTATGILLTHGHADHVDAAADLARTLNVPIYALEAVPNAPGWSVDRSILLPKTVLPVDSDTLLVLATPGHTPDGASFLLQGSGVLFTGDTILGEGSTMIAPPDGDMCAYMTSLELLFHTPATLLAPGHGPIVTVVKQKVQEYIQHRRMRETELVEQLTAGPATAAILVESLYTDTPEALHSYAVGSVLSTLYKLEGERRVERRGDYWSLVQE